MLKLLASIFSSAPASPEGIDPAVIERATERLVDGTDPRLRSVPGYRAKLRPAVVESVEHVVALVTALRAPVSLAPETYREDPRLDAMLSSPGRIREVLGESLPLQAFLGTASGAVSGAARGALCAKLERKRTYGTEGSGALLQRDVPKTVVNFADHAIVAPGEDETQTRHELMRMAFDHVVDAALEAIATRQRDREALEGSARLLRAKRRALQSGSFGLKGLTPAGDEAPREAARVEAELARVEADLQAMGAPTEALQRCIDVVVETLREPARWLRHDPISLRVDAMSYETADPDVAAFELDRVVADDGEHLEIVLVHFPTDIVPSTDELLDRARRVL